MKTQETMAPHLRAWNEKNPMAKRPPGRMKGFGWTRRVLARFGHSHQRRWRRHLMDFLQYNVLGHAHGFCGSYKREPVRIKLFAKALLSVLSETKHPQPLLQARNSIARIMRSCRPWPQCLLSTPIREKWPALWARVDGMTPAKPPAQTRENASYQ
jgi:hypothetical protein